MYISRRSDYGLILISALKGTYASKKPISIRTIAKQYHLPYAYLEKLAIDLKRAGIIMSQLGKMGGYILIKNPKQLSVLNIVDIFQKGALMRCVHTKDPKKSCALISVCPTRKGWNKIDAQIRKALGSITIDTL